MSPMKRSHVGSYRVFFLALLFAFLPALSSAQGFHPASPDELKMTGDPHAPGAPAVILMREVNRDDNGVTSHEDDYFRIKILTEEGRKYGDVELSFDKDTENVDNIHARTIQPDGRIIEFSGQVFEKTIAKARGLRYLAKTFTVPDVQVGSIVEYYYTINLREHLLFESRWILNDDELFTRRARFILTPYKARYGHMSLRRSWQGLPPGVQPVEGPNHVFTMDISDIPALEIEDFMPPPLEEEGRVNFIYEDRYFERDPVEYWRHVGRDWNDYLEAFIAKPKAMQEAVSHLISPTDTPEVKLRKLYERVQQLRNTSYEPQKTAQEEKRSKEKTAENVEQVWKRGYGEGIQLTWLFLALARAAGFDARGAWVSSRRQYFFDAKTMESWKLNTNVVLVKLNGKDLYFDPGAAFTPFGMLLWSETATTGLALDKDGGTWIKTPLPESSESRVQRSAHLKLTDDGSLEGKLTVTYGGLSSMYHRLDVLNSDDAARRQYLEDDLKAQIPLQGQFELTNKPDWVNPAAPLVAEFNVKIPNWSSSAGKRIVMPAALFGAADRHVFEHAERVHPIYFAFPYENDDDVSIELPEGWKVYSVPLPQKQTAQDLTYSLTVENGRTQLHLTRELTVDVLLLDRGHYPAVRGFFQAVRSGDEQQIMLDPASASAANTR